MTHVTGGLHHFQASARPLRPGEMDLVGESAGGSCLETLAVEQGSLMH
jgi:hypothetical protein